ncbi:MAG: orotate phosphoribosyltransferase [Armatimonadetes bacterium]|nr:orotate phosphoribosyltransferase [Armatimonadota bacterium]
METGTRTTIEELFKKTDAVKDGHFRLSSGRHSHKYLQCALVLQHPEYAEQLGRLLAAHFESAGVQTVIGPALGGIIIAHETARALGGRVIFAEREKDAMTLRRGFDLSKGERVLVVEDVLTTGGSVQEVLALVQELEAVPVGVGVLVDRSGGACKLPVPVASLTSVEVETYPPDDCPLCKLGIPMTSPGSRRKEQ